MLRILTSKTHPEINKSVLKSKNMDIWLIDTLNQLFIRGFYTRIKF